MIGVDDLPAAVMAAGAVNVEPVAGRSLKQALESPERQIIREVLEANNGTATSRPRPWASTARRSTRR